ncbi:2Fe-2S iron-sulfur cluster-binding protein [Xylophilus sp.]|uniref:2Fe-2S iron-sulfur cluster-binding protein n=1 Tax=Xylophilus sp. TaxID=2653893 RepID=UPI0013BAFF29|nr:2Fe-2S iron-sulfur cluster-binding protein [Xylophilus sp.]KAF1044476.1 MAG: Fumarate reductase iron-sulfur subunit [Xylophilus sp.]
MNQSNTAARDAIQLRVQRGNPEQTPAVREYVVPAEAAASLLDGLRWVRAHLDDTLAFRYSCINANACKECMMRLDGKTVYACTARLEAGCSYDVAPLPNKALVRDLVTEIAPSKERLFAGDDDDAD